MASRSLLHLRGGASAAARAARGRHLPAGRTWAPATAPTTTGGLADAGSFAGRIPAVQALRHYRAPFDRDASASELWRRMQENKRLGLPKENPSAGKILKSLQIDHKEFEMPKGFRRLTNAVMAVGYSITFGALIYHHAF
ncbi:unnamed protein product [Urochloa humidicola]